MAPASLPRFIRIPGREGRYIALETLIRRKTDYLFPKYHVLRGGGFRIIRDSDIEVEEEAEDLVRYFQTAIKRRRRGKVVRLELEPGMPEGLVGVVKDGLNAASATTSETRGFLGMTGLSASRRGGSARPQVPAVRSPLSRTHSQSMAATASRRSARKTSWSITPTRASRWWSSSSSRPHADPDVVAIKQTLVSRRPPVGDHSRPDRRRRSRKSGHRGRRVEGEVRRGTKI